MKKLLPYAAILLALLPVSRANAGCGTSNPGPYILPQGLLTYEFGCSWNPGYYAKWLLGNGSSKPGWGISYTYAAEGKYEVKLVVSDSAGSCSDTFAVGIICAIKTNFSVTRIGPYQYEFVALNPDTNHRKLSWNFSSGGTASGTKTVRTFPGKNHYVTKLTIYDSTYSCEAKEEKYFYVKRCIGTDTFATPNSCTQNKTASLVYADNSTAGHQLNAEIYWGDGKTDTVMNRYKKFSISHKWDSSGIKTLRLIVTDSTSCRDTVIRTAYITDTAFNNKFAGFSITKNRLGVSLKVKNGLAPWFHHWDFGDGTTSTNINETHYYKTQGSYNLCAVYKYNDISQCVLQECDTVALTWGKCGKPKPPSSAWLGSGMTCNFFVSDNSLRLIRWDFGDGNKDYSVGNYTIKHTYANEGKYQLSFIMYDSSQLCADTFSAGDLCVINVAYSITKQSAPYTYSFKALTTDTLGRRFKWIFGYVNPDSAFGTSSKYAFTQRKAYQTYLHIYDSSMGCGTLGAKPMQAYRCTGRDSIKEKMSCTINRTMDLTSFNNSSYGLKYSVKIQWGDGTDDTAMDRKYTLTKSHTWASAGTKNILIETTDTSACVDTLKLTKKIADSAFSNRFFGFTNSFIDNHTITMAVKDTAKVYFKHWDFGDGTATSSATTTSHIYANQTASYSLCAVFKSKDASPCTNTLCKTINVIGPKRCNAYFIKYADSGKTFSMYAVNSSRGRRVHWDFGDGDTSSAYAPKHTYAGLGPYQLCVTAYDSACVSTYCDTIGFDSSGVMNRAGGFTLNIVDENGNGSTGVKDVIRKTELKIYPNPANNILHVAANSSLAGKLELFSADGRIVASMRLGSDNNEAIDISNLPDGFYFAKWIGNSNNSGEVPIIIRH